LTTRLLSIGSKKPEVFEPLKAHQSPKYMVFACSDSRVCPSVTLGLQPGEAFAVRNIASMVPPYDKTRYAGVGSAIEYAVCALKVEVIVVIGHSRCGGIKALLSLQDGEPDKFHFVEEWVRIGAPAKTRVQADHASAPFEDQCSALEKVCSEIEDFSVLDHHLGDEDELQGGKKGLPMERLLLDLALNTLPCWRPSTCPLRTSRPTRSSRKGWRR